MQEEGQVDRQIERFPLQVSQTKVGQPVNVARHAPILSGAIVAEEDGTRVARTAEPAGANLDQMRMLGAKLQAAQVTTLTTGPGLRQTAQ